MGGTFLKRVILTDEQFPDFQLEADVFSWETCLWRIDVHGTIFFRTQIIKFDYGALDRKVYIDELPYGTELAEEDLQIIRSLADLAIIRAIKEDYHSQALRDSDLRLAELYQKYN